LIDNNDNLQQGSTSKSAVSVSK